ncbi:unnamed protein product [Linum tenue]|uniref:Uncharacterized protein n=1 Tax=Linum tenue TaxID=586396 RepID=A0AAV0KQB9_9ROSI|nr:unnamed protein product [Linum tenue]
MDEASSNPMEVSTNAPSQGNLPLEVDENEEVEVGICISRCQQCLPP